MILRMHLISIKRLIYQGNYGHRLFLENLPPSLNTCIKIALAMHLDNHECKYLLKKAGFTLSSANRYALIIHYAIENKIYDISEVNSLLLNNGCEEFLLI